MLKKIILLCFSLLLFACDSSNTLQSLKLKGRTMGTSYNITIIVPQEQNTSLTAKPLQKDIDAILHKINQQMSTYIETSEISQFNTSPTVDWFPVSNDFFKVIQSAQEISKNTQGAFDITAYSLVDLWGFGANKRSDTPDQQTIQEALLSTGFKQLEIRQTPPAIRKKNKQLKIDLSAIAKGFAVDKISDYLSHQNINNHLVEVGGEIRTKGVNASSETWKIAIKTPTPNGSQKPNKVLELGNIGLATSGDYLNYYVENKIKYAHILNPQTGYPAKHQLASVTVLNKSTMLADAYATALMVLGEKHGKDFALKNKLKVHMIIRDGETFKIWQSPNLQEH